LRLDGPHQLCSRRFGRRTTGGQADAGGHAPCRRRRTCRNMTPLQRGDVLRGKCSARGGSRHEMFSWWRGVRWQKQAVEAWKSRLSIGSGGAHWPRARGRPDHPDEVPPKEKTLSQ
jgi:hypothetical protein